MIKNQKTRDSLNALVNRLEDPSDHVTKCDFHAELALSQAIWLFTQIAEDSDKEVIRFLLTSPELFLVPSNFSIFKALSTNLGDGFLALTHDEGKGFSIHHYCVDEMYKDYSPWDFNFGVVSGRNKIYPKEV